MEGRPPFLIVEDEPGIRRTLRRLLVPFADVIPAGSVAEGLGVLATRPSLSGAIIDVALPDGNGITVIDAIRAEQPLLLVLVCTANCEGENINRALDLGAFYAVKPIVSRRIQRFARGAIGLLPADDSNAGIQTTPPTIRSCVPAVLVAYAHRMGLSGKQIDLVESAVWGVTPAEYRLEQGISENTYKSHVRNILARTTEPTMLALRATIMRLVAEELRAASSPPEG